MINWVTAGLSMILCAAVNAILIGRQSMKRGANKDFLGNIMAFLLTLVYGLIIFPLFLPFSEHIARFWSSAGDFLFYILACIIGVIISLIVRKIYSWILRNGKGMSDSEVSLVLFVDCLGLAGISFAIDYHLWGWAFITLAIGRIFWIDLTRKKICQIITEFREKVSDSCKYACLIFSLISIAAIIDACTPSKTDWITLGSLLGILISSIACILYQRTRLRKRDERQ